MVLIDILLLVVVGLLAGALAAALGIGGGVVFVPALVIILEFEQHLAQGTSLAVILPTALVGLIGHASGKRIDWRVAIPAALAGLGGGVWGAHLALELDADLLRRMFAVALVLIAVRLGFRARRLYLERPGLDSLPSP